MADYPSVGPASAPPSSTIVTSTRPHIQSTRAGGSSSSHAGQRSSASGSGAPPTSHMESTITRLLVATKQLLEGLAKWSRGEINEEAISEIYVKLGNDFNVACAAFARENIKMNELLSVPSDLRVCLETCLSEPPSQATLERHLPKVRQIIIGLLHGLREKQRQYRDGVAARKQKEREARGSHSSRQGSISGSRPSSSVATSSALSKDPLTPNTASRSRDDLRKFVTQAQASSSSSAATTGGSGPSVSHRASNPNPQPVAQPSSSSLGARPVAASSSDPSLQSSSSLAPDSRYDESASVPQRAPLSRSNSAREERSYYAPDGESSIAATTSQTGITSRPNRSSGSMRESSRPSRNTLDSIGESFYSASSRPTLQQTRSTGSITSSPRHSLEQRAISPPPPAPPTFIRQTVENSSESPSEGSGASVPMVYVDGPSSATTGSTAMSTVPSAAVAAQMESLEALKASDNLSRRASKRYSAYAISKMTMSGSASASGLSGLAATSPLRGDAAHESGRSERVGASGSGGSGSRKVVSTRGVQGVSGSINGSPRRVKNEYNSSSRSIGGSDSISQGFNHDVSPPLPPLPPSLSSGHDLRSGTVESIPEDDSRTPSGRALVEQIGQIASPLPPAIPLPPTPTTISTVDQSRTSFDNSLSNAATSMGSVRSPSDIIPPSSATASSDHPRPMHVQSQPTDAEPAIVSVFLQIGREVKKVPLVFHDGQPPMLSEIRQLFVERFGYNPGQVDFPAVYIRDRAAGIDYELEDVGEVQNGSVLSLNIDTVEQVKQHIDQGLSALSQEMQELRSTMSAMRRTSVTAHQLFTPDHANGIGMASSVSPRPTERQFQDAAQRVVKMRKLGSTPNLALSSATSPKIEQQTAGGVSAEAVVATSTSDAVPSVAEGKSSTGDAAPEMSPTQSVAGDAFTAQVVETLKTQHQEVQNLRREIGIIRQVYLDFTHSTKSLISNLRVQSSHVHRLASTKIQTDRTFVEAGTTKLDSESTDLVVKVDEVTDTIDQMRADTVRGVRARPAQLSEMSLTITRLSKTRDELVKWLAGAKPKWQEAWSNELAKVLGEQERVQNQEALLGELGDDLDDVRGVLKNLEVVSKQQPLPVRSGSSAAAVTAGSGSGSLRGTGARLNSSHHRSSADGGAGGGLDLSDGLGGGSTGDLTNVLYEVQGLRPDPVRRLEAIARAERQRELENANRTDEFEQELSGFVREGKLRKSGGIEETERLRQARSEATLKAMFVGSG